MIEQTIELHIGTKIILKFKSYHLNPLPWRQAVADHVHVARKTIGETEISIKVTKVPQDSRIQPVAPIIIATILAKKEMIINEDENLLLFL